MSLSNFILFSPERNEECKKSLKNTLNFSNLKSSTFCDHFERYGFAFDNFFLILNQEHCISLLGSCLGYNHSNELKIHGCKFLIFYKGGDLIFSINLKSLKLCIIFTAQRR